MKKATPLTGPLPIAAAMNPTSTKYYVSNYLGHSISVIDMGTGNKIKDINLLQTTIRSLAPSRDRSVVCRFKLR